MEKVYCKNCRHYQARGDAIIPYSFSDCCTAPATARKLDSWYSVRTEYPACEVKNSANNCKDFEEKKPF